MQNQLTQAANLQDEIINGLASKSNISVYNIWNTVGGGGPEVPEPYEVFLATYALNELGAPKGVNVTNTGCNESVYNAFAADITADFSSDVATLITQG
jgi:hypothetical protein